ncbi:XRE family transcriptional regulator [Actinomadura sp. 7K507]|nr:XRE family transcriptional regulator [Actinomadura sp. 7K507]
MVPAWFGPYLTLEPELDLIRVYAPRRVPGLLQTPDYARHMITEDLPGIPADELAQRIELRQLRQQVLHRPDAPRYWAIIDPRALARRTAPPTVLRGQLRHLIAMAAYPHITLQLVCSTDAERVVPAGPITLMRFPEPGVGDIVYLEQNDHGIYVDDSESVDYFALRYQQLALKAMEPHASVSLLLKMLDRLQP